MAICSIMVHFLTAYINYWDVFHYVLGSKYNKELKDALRDLTGTEREEFLEKIVRIYGNLTG